MPEFVPKMEGKPIMRTENFDRDWYDSLETDHADSVKMDIAVAIERALATANISRSDLAELISSSPAWITKVLRGDANLTIETMCRLATALEHEVHIHLAPKDAFVRWFEAYERVTSSHRKNEKATLDWTSHKEISHEWKIPAAA